MSNNQIWSRLRLKPCHALFWRAGPVAHQPRRASPITSGRKAPPTCATSQTFSMNTDATVSRMGVWPPGAGLQGQAPNHPMLLRLRGVVVSDGEKADLSRQVSDEKMSKSEPLKTHRKVFQKLSKRAKVGGARKSVDVTCLRSTRQPVFRRHELIAGLDTERGNLTWGAKGKPQVATTTRANTNTHGRGGAARSSDEGAVMALEQRGCVIQTEPKHQPVRWEECEWFREQRAAINEWSHWHHLWQQCWDNRSRMT